MEIKNARSLSSAAKGKLGQGAVKAVLCVMSQV